MDEVTPEWVMDRATGGCLDAARRAAERTAAGAAAWGEVAELVGRMSAVVADGYDRALAAEAAADEARTCATGVVTQWARVRPLVTHLRRLAGGGLACTFLLFPAGGWGWGNAHPPESPADPLEVEKAARDLPRRERYTVLARLALARGDAKAAEWFAHKARQ